jgi:hypothetical protein
VDVEVDERDGFRHGSTSLERTLDSLHAGAS